MYRVMFRRRLAHLPLMTFPTMSEAADWVHAQPFKQSLCVLLPGQEVRSSIEARAMTVAQVLLASGLIEQVPDDCWRWGQSWVSNETLRLLFNAEEGVLGRPPLSPVQFGRAAAHALADFPRRLRYHEGRQQWGRAGLRLTPEAEQVLRRLAAAEDAADVEEARAALARHNARLAEPAQTNPTGEKPATPPCPARRRMPR